MPRNRSEKVVEHTFQTDALTLLLYATCIKEGRLVGFVGKGLYELNDEQENAESAVRMCAGDVCNDDADFFETMTDGAPFNDGRNAVADLIIGQHRGMVQTLMCWAHTIESGDGYQRLNASMHSMSMVHRNIFTAWPDSTKTALGKRLLVYARAVSRDLSDALFPTPTV